MDCCWNRPRLPLRPRACQFLSSVPSLDPVHRCGHAEHAHEGAGGLLVAGCHGPPLLEPRPKALDAVAVLVDPRRTGHRGFVALGWDRRAGTEAPDEFAEGMAGVAAVGHDPKGDNGKGGQQQWRQRQLVRLPGRQRKADGTALCISNHAGLAAKAAARAAKRLVFVALR